MFQQTVFVSIVFFTQYERTSHTRTLRISKIQETQNSISQHLVDNNFQMTILGAGEMSQPFRALATSVEDLGLIPSMHIAAHNHP